MAARPYDGLILGSGTLVTKEISEAGAYLKVIGRTGTGVDSIDAQLNKCKGIFHANTPGGNTISHSELILSYILALACNIPQAIVSLKAGRWDRTLYTDLKLLGKMLCVIGAGKIGREVAKSTWGRRFGMKVDWCTLALPPSMLLFNNNNKPELLCREKEKLATADIRVDASTDPKLHMRSLAVMASCTSLTSTDQYGAAKAHGQWSSKPTQKPYFYCDSFAGADVSAFQSNLKHVSMFGRRYQASSVHTQDSLTVREAASAAVDSICRDVVQSQPHVLLVPDALLAKAFPDWIGRVHVLSSSSNAALLPFVNRLPTLVSMVNALEDNHRCTEDIEMNSYMVRSLQLVSSCALFGAGKTRISSVLYKCLQQRVSEPDQKFVFCQIAMDVVKSPKSPYTMWRNVVARVPGMEGIKNKITKDMSLTELLEITADHLSSKNLLMYLHLDEFVPFDEDGALDNTRESFYQCWKEVLVPILQTRGVFLYISGRLPYFDTICSGDGYQPPCNVLSIQLDLFSSDVILESLRKISISAHSSTSDASDSIAATISLSEALDALPRTMSLTVQSGKESGLTTQPGEGTAREVARRLHELTGGVPRFFEHALHALLTDPVIHAALFHGDHSGDPGRRLRSLFETGEALYNAVSFVAKIHFGHAVYSIRLLKDGDEALEEHVAGMLAIAFLQGQTLRVDQKDLKSLMAGMEIDRSAGQLSFLLQEALYWGFHRDVSQEKLEIKFPVPPAILAGLKPVLRMMDIVEYIRKDKRDQMKTNAQHAVKLALVFHRLMAGELESHTSLETEESSGIVSADSLPIGALRSFHWDRLSLFELPHLPRIHSTGKLRQVSEVADITYSSSYGDNTDSRACRPKLAGQFINGRSGSAFHAFATAPDSASADFIVRHARNVTHLHVCDTQVLEVQKMLDDCGHVAAMIKGAPDLDHSLVWVVMQNDALKGAMESLAGLKELLDSDKPAESIASAVVSGELAELLNSCKQTAQQQSRQVAAKREEKKVKKNRTVGGKVAEEDPKLTTADKDKKKNVLVAIALFRKRKLHMTVLNEHHRDAFFKYNKIAEDLLGM